MNKRKFKVYYGIYLKIVNTQIKNLEKEILQDEYLKELYYYFDNNSISDKIKKLPNKKNTLTITITNANKYICLNKEYNNLKDIINTYLVVPRFYIENFNITKYKEKLIELEKTKDPLWHQQVDKYNKIFNQNFNVLDGINSIYEWYTGAVYFKDYEWEQIKNNELKNLFNTKINNSYIYSLPLENGIILRGADIYYYFSSDISRFEKPNQEQIKVWHKNCNKFLNKCKRIIKNYQIENNFDLRLLLGIIDNLRNIILILFNSELLAYTKGQNFIYHCNSQKNKNIDKYISLTTTYMNLINSICLERPINIDINKKILETITILSSLSNKTMKKVQTINDAYLLSKCFNPLREIDNYFENYITCNFAFNQINKSSEINLIGALYGGLELPYIIKNNYKKNKINISLIYQNFGMYLDRQIKSKNIILDNLIEIGSINKNIPTYIVDDNMMSGVTIQFIYNQLRIKKYQNIKGIIIIRHPNLNRLAQLAHFRTGINLEEVDNTIYGMLTDTPYSKIKFNSNLNNMFVNELNIFSIMTEVFLKALYKNNSFIKDSQVDIFLGYSEGKND